MARYTLLGDSSAGVNQPDVGGRCVRSPGGWGVKCFRSFLLVAGVSSTVFAGVILSGGKS